MRQGTVKFSINNNQARQDARADLSYSHTACYRLRHSSLPYKFSDKFIVSYEIYNKRYSCRCQRTAKSGIEKSHKDIGEYSCFSKPYSSAHHTCHDQICFQIKKMPERTVALISQDPFCMLFAHLIKHHAKHKKYNDRKQIQIPLPIDHPV